jgi:hypothetical protein
LVTIAFVPEGQRHAVKQMSDYVKTQIAEAGTRSGTLSVQKTPTETGLDIETEHSKWLN